MQHPAGQPCRVSVSTMVTAKGMGVALSGALAVHAVVLVMVWVSGGPLLTTQAVQARPVQVVRHPVAEPVAATSNTATKLPPDIQLSKHDAQPAVQDESTVTNIASAPTTTAVGDTAPSGFDYVPRERLTVVPVPLGAIEVPFPESVAGDITATVRLSLFIDEAGQVKRVRIDDGPMRVPALEQAALDAFAQAKFKPGQLEGRVVRSLVRIEVTFESRPLGASSPAH